MLITLSRRTAICQLVAEVCLIGVAPLGAVNQRFLKIKSVSSFQLECHLKLATEQIYHSTSCELVYIYFGNPCSTISTLKKINSNYVV